MLSSLYTGGSAQFDALLFVVKMKYDETPSKVGVVETPETTYMSPILRKSPGDFLTGDDWETFQKLTAIGSDKQTSTHAKVTQTSMEMAMLIKHKISGKNIFLHGQLPTSLQVVERTTAECIRSCLWDAIQAWSA